MSRRRLQESLIGPVTLGAIDDLSRSEARLAECERMAGVGSWELTPATGALTYSHGFARLLG